MATNDFQGGIKKGQNQGREITYENREIMFDPSGH